MSQLLKDIYSLTFYDRLSNILAPILPSFQKRKFIPLIFDSEWKQKALKERMYHTAFVLHQFMPPNFIVAAKTIKNIVEALSENQLKQDGLALMFIPHYIETYGINHFKASVKLIELVTPLTSCEFAVRPFIIQYGDSMLQQMLEWSLHKNEHVRRLASEGSRPRLPWAIALPALKKDPSPILPILQNLQNDPSSYVRRSVANSINDISKDHPELVCAIAKKWKGVSKETDAILKHGCRTLLKKGYPAILQFYQLHNNTAIVLQDFSLQSTKVSIGGNVEFSFSIMNLSNKQQLIRLEYAIYYLRLNKQWNKKVFKITERILMPKEQVKINKKQSFKIITTRKFYVGPQQIAIIMNGIEKINHTFTLRNV